MWDEMGMKNFLMIDFLVNCIGFCVWSVLVIEKLKFCYLFFNRLSGTDNFRTCMHFWTRPIIEMYIHASIFLAVKKRALAIIFWQGNCIFAVWIMMEIEHESFHLIFWWSIDLLFMLIQACIFKWIECEKSDGWYGT